MKKIFTILLLLSACFSFGQNTFRTGTISSNYNQLYDVVQLADGSLVGLGYSEENSEEEEFIGYVYLVKLNTQGQLIASYRLTSYAGTDIYADGFKLIKTKDGNLAFCGSIADNIALYKFDTNLNLLFRKQYKTPEESSYGSGLLQTPEGGYIIAGSHYRENSALTNYNGAGILIKTNDTGKVIWSKQYADIPDAEYGYTDFTDILLAKNGNYVALAQAGSSTDLDHDTTYLIETDTSGKVLWSKYMSTNLNNQTPASLLATTDNGYLITGSVDTIYAVDELTNRYHFLNAMIVKCDTSGNVLWSRRGNNGIGHEVNLSGALEDKDGGYIVAGAVDSTDGIFTDDYFKSDGYILKVNSTGTLQWTKEFTDGGRYQEFFDIVRTTDGGYAACGDLSYPYDEDFAYDSALGLIYKFDAAFSTCYNANAYGGLLDLKASFTDKTMPYHEISSSAFTDAIVTSATGTDTVLCSRIYPVQLLSFNAVLQNKGVSIEWKTTNEINTASFTVERSSNGRTFTSLQTLAAVGNGSTVQTYSTNDLQPLSGTSYYRLKQTDKDGSFTYSHVVSVTMSAGGVVVISPNPVRNDIRVLLQSNAVSKTIFTVADLTGKTLLTQTTSINAGTSTVTIPAVSLSRGLYVLKVITGTGIQSLKFIKE